MTIVWLLAGAAALLWAIGKIQSARFVSAHRPFGVVRMERGAVFLGIEAQGLGQRPARGILLLTKKRVAFFQAIPLLELDTTLAKVEAATVGESFLGKRGKFLVLVTREPTGRRTHAFTVTDPEAWVEAFVAVEGKGVRLDSPEGPDLSKLR
ncbi:hypothetical protein IIA16_04080 [bacterium]|nr:hypothetical protein [bacterium]